MYVSCNSKKWLAIRFIGLETLFRTPLDLGTVNVLHNSSSITANAFVLVDTNFGIQFYSLAFVLMALKKTDPAFVQDLSQVWTGTT